MSRQGNFRKRSSREGLRALLGGGLLYALLCPVVAHAQPAKPATAAGAAPAAPATADELRLRANDVRIAVQQACEQRAELHGAWIYNLRLDPDRPDRWMIDLIVDSASAQKQRQTIEELLRNEMRIGRQTSLPIRALLAALRSRLETRFGKQGHFIQGAFCKETDAGVLQLAIFGRVPEAGLQDAVAGECSALMDADPVWYDGSPANKKLLPDGRTLLGPAWDKETEQVAEELHRELRTDSVARGAWVELAECRDQLGNFVNYDVYTWLDAPRAAAQRKAVQALLDRFLSRKFVVVQEKALPLTRFLNSVNLLMEAHSRYDGCSIDDAHFEPQPNSLSGAILVVRGRITRPELADQIVGQVCVPWMKSDPGWSDGAGQFFVERPDLQVVEPVLGRAARFFELGYERYGESDFAAAAEAFRNASIDAPRTTEYRYWRILSLLQNGQSAEAFDHMLALVNRKPLPVSDRAVLRSFERVQGPVRMELIALRRRAESLFYLEKRLRAPVPISPTGPVTGPATRRDSTGDYATVRRGA